MRQITTPIPTDLLQLIGRNPDDAHYRTVTIQKEDSRWSGYNITFDDIDDIDGKDLVVQLDDFREHIGVIGYAMFPKETLETLVKNHLKFSGKLYWFDVKDILPVAPIFFLRHGEAGSKMCIRRVKGLQKFEFAEVPIKIVPNRGNEA